MDFREELSRLGAGLFDLAEWQLAALAEHFAALLHWNRRLNLTGLSDPQEIVRRHYAESLFLATLLPPEHLSIADVGTGAGFPGYPIAVLRPDCRVALVEASAKKAVFLRQACGGVANIRVVEARAEAVPERFDWVVARAVAWRQLERLIPKLAGRVALLVGEKSVGELRRRRDIVWQEPARVPWLRSGVAVLGRCLGESGVVPRETPPPGGGKRDTMT